VNNVLKNLTTLGVLTILLMTYSMISRSETLFAHGNDDQLYLIDTETLSASLVGQNNIDTILPEIEQSPSGTIFGSDTIVNTRLHSINPDTGNIFETQTMFFPAGGNVITAMEFVDQTLYAGFTTEGSHSGSGSSSLVTIDPLTGNVTAVGVTGIANPLGGLAYDDTTMYAVSAGGAGSLYTIDLGTGEATLVGETGFALTALEFGENGVLYGLHKTRSSLTNHLLSINTSTGAGTDLGFLGGAPIVGLVALTSTPPLPPALNVTIDIKPGNTKNRVNPLSKGKLKVAILTTRDFDASMVDASTVRFGPGAAAPIRYRLDEADDDDDTDDSDDDEDDYSAWDLILKFNIPDTAISCGDTEATLTAQTFDGIQVTGTDSIKTAGC